MGQTWSSSVCWTVTTLEQNAASAKMPAIWSQSVQGRTWWTKVTRDSRNTEDGQGEKGRLKKESWKGQWQKLHSLASRRAPGSCQALQANGLGTGTNCWTAQSESYAVGRGGESSRCWLLLLRVEIKMAPAAPCCATGNWNTEFWTLTEMSPATFLASETFSLKSGSQGLELWAFGSVSPAYNLALRGPKETA